MNSNTIREMFVTALHGNTEAKNRVYSPKDWATYDAHYPVILVTTPLESKNSLGRNIPQFNTVTTVQVLARVSTIDDFTSGDFQSLFNAELIKEQIEKAIINSYELTRNIQQFLSVKSQIQSNALGEEHITELLMLFDVEYYQGPECFYDVDSSNLTGIDIQVKQPEATISPVTKIDL
ncbi:hypothetical protein RHO12_12685 (plasmid) [Orbus sturtevantii]|uniref:ATP-binding protein n=1 Tax=Orbus sturtevantii TaxID=3074109 RepID=UPI00370D02AE